MSSQTWIRVCDRDPGVDQGVERGNPVGLGRGHREPLGDVTERSLAHRARGVLHRVQCGKQEVASFPSGMPSVGDMAVEPGEMTALPPRLRRAKHIVDGPSLDLCWSFEQGADVH